MKPETTRITEELIEAAKSERGGWTKAQFAILGVSWPPQPGWKLRVIGNLISHEEAKRLVTLRNTAREDLQQDNLL
jgi:hypothetical protein